MNGEGEASLTIALDNHLQFQETYTLRHDIPPMIQQHQRTLVTSTTIPEEDEEEEVEEEHIERERREDSDYIGKEEDNFVDIANRAFMLTCKKFSKQSYPEFRRRQAYSFLETWYLHSMYSKSQQILLGITQAKPVVLLSGDDFMFTPQLVQQQHFDRMQQQQLDYWHDDDYDDDMMDDDDYDDEEDEDVLIVQTHSRLPKTSTTTGTTSRMMIDENMWMGSSRHHQQDEQVDDDGSHVVHENIQDANDNDREIQQELHEEQIEQVNEQEEETEYAVLSPEVVHWYRSAQFHHRRPSTIMEVDEEEEEEEEVITETTITTIIPTITITSTTTGTVAAEEYQSLADIITSSPYQQQQQQQQQQETVITIPAITHDDNEQQISTVYGTTITRRIKTASDEHEDNRMVIRNYFDTYHVSTRIVDTAWLVLETADTLTQDKQNVPIRQFTCYMFSIWRVLFLCVESILSDVGGLFTKSSKSKSFYPSTTTNSTTTITTTNASLLV
ncbi:hypothetical protein BDC45DRAFT_573710 [Circinella umbellata]|nr:hypothetical protein BDC45DRAFT_573710 [Circinella umbellata]